MSNDSSKPSKYTTVLDLTQRAQDEARRERTKDQFASADPSLTDATVDSLPEILQAGVRAAGWSTLTPVQSRAIPHMLERHDLMVQSRTGSGKTGAFILPLFEILDDTLPAVQALILSPTRELAKQIQVEFERLNPPNSKLRSVPVYGGVRYGPQKTALEEGANLVVGTPGRVLDLIEQRALNLDKLVVFVLDEADEMLSMGFYPAMRRLKHYLPEKRNSYMFSATMPGNVQNLSSEFLSDPLFLGLSAGKEAVERMEHQYYVVPKMDKDRAIIKLVEMENPESGIIFANTKREVEYMSQFLQNYGHDADALSGDLSQPMREQVMGKIRDGQLRFLVATDVAARGIDISDLSHVIMFDVPQDPEYYVHRSGRTARAGKAGKVLVLASVEDQRPLLAMARRYGIELERLPMPTDEEVEERVMERTTVMLEQQYRDKTNLEKERLARFRAVAEQLAAEEPELLAMLVDDFYHEQLHRAAPSVDQPSGKKKQPRDDDSSRRGQGGGSRKKRR